MTDLPFVLPIHAHAPHGYWNIVGHSVGSAILISNSVGEVEQPEVVVTKVNARIHIEEVVIAYVIAAEASAELKGVIAPGHREIIDELILRNVPALGKRSCRVKAGKGHRTREDGIERQSLCGLRTLLKLGHVMASRRGKRIRRVRSKHMRFVNLEIV